MLNEVDRLKKRLASMRPISQGGYLIICPFPIEFHNNKIDFAIVGLSGKNLATTTQQFKIDNVLKFVSQV